MILKTTYTGSVVPPVPGHRPPSAKPWAGGAITSRGPEAASPGGIVGGGAYDGANDAEASEAPAVDNRAACALVRSEGCCGGNIGAGCAIANNPGYYAKVSHYINWIATNTNGDFGNATFTPVSPPPPCFCNLCVNHWDY